jgi:hypothetical protein
MQDATYLSTTKQVGHITTLAKSFRRSLLSENKAPAPSRRTPMLWSC